MNEEKKTSKESTPLEHLMFKGHLQITIRVITITIVTMGLFAGGGYLLDKQFGTSPLLLVIGLVVAFPVIQLIIFKKFRQITNDLSKK